MKVFVNHKGIYVRRHANLLRHNVVVLVVLEQIERSNE